MLNNDPTKNDIEREVNIYRVRGDTSETNRRNHRTQVTPEKQAGRKKVTERPARFFNVRTETMSF